MTDRTRSLIASLNAYVDARVAYEIERALTEDDPNKLPPIEVLAANAQKTEAELAATLDVVTGAGALELLHQVNSPTGSA
jgi:hypothetical protein